MKNDYDRLIYFTICDVLYDEMLKTQYYSFDSFCKNLAYCIIGNGSITKDQYKIISKLLKTISEYYEIDRDSVGGYIREFFNKEMYLIYGKTVMVIKSNVKNYKRKN